MPAISLWTLPPRFKSSAFRDWDYFLLFHICNTLFWQGKFYIVCTMELRISVQMVTDFCIHMALEILIKIPGWERHSYGEGAFPGIWLHVITVWLFNAKLNDVQYFQYLIGLLHLLLWKCQNSYRNEGNSITNLHAVTISNSRQILPPCPRQYVLLVCLFAGVFQS